MYQVTWSSWTGMHCTFQNPNNMPRTLHKPAVFRLLINKQILFIEIKTGHSIANNGNLHLNNNTIKSWICITVSAIKNIQNMKINRQRMTEWQKPLEDMKVFERGRTQSDSTSGHILHSSFSISQQVSQNMIVQVKKKNT